MNQKIIAYLEGEVNRYSLPSLQVLVTRNSKTVLRYQYQCDEKSMYIGYSSTKPVIGAAIAKLITEGRTALDIPAYEYLPEMRNLRVFKRDQSGMIIGEEKLDEGKPILIGHLVSMTGGIADNIWTDYIQSAIQSGKKSSREIVEAILRQPLSFEPGTDFKYGLSLDVLAVIIEQITGKKLSEYLVETFFEPLNMQDTTFHPTAGQKSRILQQYMWYDDGGYCYAVPNVNDLVFTEEYESGGAGLYFTGDDYMKFAAMLANGGTGQDGERILSAEAIENMRTPLLNQHNKERFRTLLGFPGYSYGMGVRVMDEPGKQGYLTPAGEFGWQGKGGTYSSICPELHTAIFMGIQVCDYHPVNTVMHNELREKLYGAIINDELS